MFKRSIMLAASVLMIIVIGCAVSVPRPGTSGKSSTKIIKTGHPDIPDGVKCYVCHKRERPVSVIHDKFGINCEKCHGTSTWMAFKYSHDSWPLGIHRKMQCSRCHTKVDVFDFSWQCWGCHHEKTQTLEVHKKRGHNDIGNCIECHKGAKKG